MVGLLDVNIIIALFVETHKHHGIAKSWLVDEASQDGWETCPLVELGAIRILMNPKIASSGVATRCRREELPAS